MAAVVCGESFSDQWWCNRPLGVTVAPACELAHFRQVPGPRDIRDAVDAFMAAPKRIVSADLPGEWLQGYRPNERQMKYPLEVGGELLGPQLVVVGFPRERQLKFRVGILFPAMICRLDYTDETHANSLGGITDLGLPPDVVGPHYHSWLLNRRFFHGTTVPLRLHNATPYPGAGRSFDAILRWYCADTNIEPLPANHAIGLPPQELV
jgi:hypothetical protein